MGKKLYVVLTRSNTIISNLIHIIKEDEYTYAALALDRNLEYMFSFGRRYANNPFLGCFRREQLHKGIYARHKELPPQDLSRIDGTILYQGNLKRYLQDRPIWGEPLPLLTLTG